MNDNHSNPSYGLFQLCFMKSTLYEVLILEDRASKFSQGNTLNCAIGVSYRKAIIEKLNINAVLWSWPSMDKTLKFGLNLPFVFGRVSWADFTLVNIYFTMSELMERSLLNYHTVKLLMEMPVKLLWLPWSLSLLCTSHFASSKFPKLPLKCPSSTLFSWVYFRFVHLGWDSYHVFVHIIRCQFVLPWLSDRFRKCNWFSEHFSLK